MKRAVSATTAIRLAAFLQAALLATASVPGRDDDILVEPDAAADAAARQPHMIDLDSNFAANLFEQRGNGWVIRGGQGRPAEAAGATSLAVSRGRDLGRSRLERIEATCGLSAGQRRRLSLAVESDARRFAAEVEAVRSKYIGRQVNMNDPAGQREWHAFQQEVSRCRNLLRDLYGKGSLFATVLASTLGQDQLDCLAAETAAHRSFHWRAMVLEVVTKIDDSLGLDQAQYDEIVAALLATEPPLRTDADALERDDANLRRNLVLMVLAGVDARQLRARLSEPQWRTISQLMNQGKAMRSWIEQQGVLEGKP